MTFRSSGAPVAFDGVEFVSCDTPDDDFCSAGYYGFASTDADGNYTMVVDAGSIPAGTYQLQASMHFEFLQTGDSVSYRAAYTEKMQLTGPFDITMDIKRVPNDIQFKDDTICGADDFAEVSPTFTCDVTTTVMNVTGEQKTIDVWAVGVMSQAKSNLRGYGHDWQLGAPERLVLAPHAS